MRRLLFGFSLLALSACVGKAPDLTFPVFFQDFSSSLDPAGTQVVANAAAMLQKYPTATATVTGYADATGSTDEEVRISKARADAVAALLTQDGVASNRISRAAVGTPPNSQPGVERRRVEIDINP